MKISIKKDALVLLAFFTFMGMNAQTGTKTLSIIANIIQLEPIIMNDTTDFFVQVSVNDASVLNQDSIYGDLFYYYLTDSMISASVNARIINDDSNDIYINPTIADTVHIDIRPDEIKTTPVNLIILWPAMINPEVADTDSSTIVVGFDGYLSLPSITGIGQKNLIFPCPAIQYIYIRQEELSLIKQIRILSIEGKTINQYDKHEFSSGFINIDYLATGPYFVELNYYNNNVVRTKILKR